ncbi:hypothetical protein JTE90_028636 [Oedothorax gibbosus]|uniref:histone acetyltransferase n=1 Tax=Oedothorax gibbosus TaxID=931172 RepID=A0AAV6UZB3_9ARAC|nr:hypothetical protein JTE90_028636 [Oedothorax gibbosus]
MAKTQSRQDQFVYICHNCNYNVETRWHCTVCDDFDLCVKCYTKDGHVHKMQKLGFELGNDSTVGEKKQINPKCIKLTLTLEHACQCSDANCGLLSCRKMKRMVSHAKKCKRRDSCAICKYLVALNCLHSKNCQKNTCPVLFCLSLKNKLKQRRMTQQQIPKPQSQLMGANNMPNPAGAASGPGVGPSQVMAKPECQVSDSCIKLTLTLEHACQCSDANCGLLSCRKMKRIVLHAKKCKRRDSCAICKYLVALNCLHSKNCQKITCPVLFCLSLKNKMKQRRMTQQQIPKPQSQMIGANNMPNPAGAAPGPGVGPSQVMAKPKRQVPDSCSRGAFNKS